MTTRSKSVILKNWEFPKIGPAYRPKRGMNISYTQIDKKNKEWYATLYGTDRPNNPCNIITKGDINGELSRMSKFLLSDRARTLKNRPRIQKIGDRIETIQ